MYIRICKSILLNTNNIDITLLGAQIGVSAFTACVSWMCILNLASHCIGFLALSVKLGILGHDPNGVTETLIH